MNPQMMAQAQQMMANMSPEQRKNMEDMVKNMPPDQHENMRRMAMQMGAGGTPAAPAAAPAPAGVPSYEFNAATILKNEGNDLHKAGQHRDAISKYERAQKNLESLSTAEARSLKVICMLNTAMCLLKVEDWKPCVSICTQVLTGGPNLKASYRRGQAHMGLALWSDAVCDLQQALQQCAAGDPQRDLIAEKLASARSHLPDGPAKSAPSYNDTYNNGSVTIEEVDTSDDDAAAPSAAPRAAPAPAAARGVAPADAAQMMADNPEQVKQMADEIDKMSDSQFEQYARAAGMGSGMSRAMAKQTVQMMASMPPEQLKAYASMASSMHGGGGGAASTPASAPAGAPAAPPGGAPDAAQAAQAAQMMENMSDEQLESMMSAAQGSGMMPAGMNLTPEALKASVSMMKNMGPEDMKRMQEMSAGMMGGRSGPAAAGPSSGGAPGGMDAAAMLSNPAMMQTALSSMKNMSEDDLAGMMKMGQPGMSDEAARQAAKQMKSLDPDSKVVRALMGTASVAARGYQGVTSAKSYLQQNPMVALALALVVLAVLLRVTGVL